MKHGKILAAVIVLAAAVCAPSAADIVPDGFTSIPRIIRIENCSDYPDIVLVGYIDEIMTPSGASPYLIGDDTVLFSGYKFNGLYVIALSADYVENAGGIEAIDYEQLVEANGLERFLSPHGGLVPVSAGIEGEYVYYRITGTTATGVDLSIDRVVYTFSNGLPDRVVEF